GASAAQPAITATSPAAKRCRVIDSTLTQSAVDPDAPRSTTGRSLQGPHQLARCVDVTTECEAWLDAKEVDMTTAKNAVPQGLHTVTAQLTLDNAAQT